MNRLSVLKSLAKELKVSINYKDFVDSNTNLSDKDFFDKLSIEMPIFDVAYKHRILRNSNSMTNSLNFLKIVVIVGLSIGFIIALSVLAG